MIWMVYVEWAVWCDVPGALLLLLSTSPEMRMGKAEQTNPTAELKWELKIKVVNKMRFEREGLGRWAGERKEGYFFEGILGARTKKLGYFLKLNKYIN